MAKAKSNKKTDKETVVFKCDEKGCDYSAKSKGAITAHWNKQHRKKNAQKRGTKHGRKDNQDNGRPTSLTPKKVGELVAAFQNGLTVKQACNYAGVSKDAYYYAMSEDRKGKFYDDFKETMRAAQAHLNFKARQVIAQAIISGSDLNARWWLERKNKDEFSPRREVTGNKGGPVRTQRIGTEDMASDEELNEAIFGKSK